GDRDCDRDQGGQDLAAPQKRRRAALYGLGLRGVHGLRQSRVSRYVGTSQTTRKPTSSAAEAPWTSTVTSSAMASAKLKRSHAPVQSTTRAPRAAVRTAVRPRSTSS